MVAVNEGALPAYADEQVTELTPEAVVRASLTGTRRDAPVFRPDEVARRVLELYERAGARR